MPLVSEKGATNQGQRRDLSEMLYQADKKKCPLKSAIKKGKYPAAFKAEWAHDSFDDPKIDGVVEGKDVTEFEDAFPKYGLLSSYIHKLRRTAMVSDLQEEVADPAGIGQKKSMAKATAKKLIEIGRDLETLLLSDRDAQAGAGTAKAYETRGLLKWTDANAAGACPIPEYYRTPTGSVFSGAAVNTLTERKFTDMMQARYDEVGEPIDLRMYCGTALRSHISQFSTLAPEVTDMVVVRRHNSSKQDVLSQKVTMVETEFGSFSLHNSSFINIGGNPKSVASRHQGIAFDMGNLELNMTKAPTWKPLQDNGGGPRGLIETIVMLRVANPLDLMRVNPSNGQ